MGRKSRGVSQAIDLEGSAFAKERLAIIMREIAGELSVSEACEALSLHRAQYSELRKGMLAGALHTLEPKRLGRPAKQIDPLAKERGQLEELRRELMLEREALLIREYITITMPGIVQRKNLSCEKRGSQVGHRGEP